MSRRLRFLRIRGGGIAVVRRRGLEGRYFYFVLKGVFALVWKIGNIIEKRIFYKIL